MAAQDMNAIVRVKDKNGNVNNIYPATKIGNVEGLQTALNSKANASDVTSGLAGKVDKETGKVLSTNDYTTAEKNKLAGIAAGATANIGTVTQVKVGSTAYNPSSGVVSLPAYPTTLPASDVYSWAKASSKPTYTASEVGLGNVGNFKAVSTVASQGLSDTEKSNARANIGAGTSSFSGSYNDLSNKPTIPTKTSQLTNDSGYTTNTGTVTGVKVGSTSYNPSSGVVSLPAYPTSLPASDVYSWAKASSKPTYTASEVGLGNVGNFKAVSTVASQGLSDTEKSNARANIGAGTSSFSGSYNDLSNKPTIPTKTSQLTNDSGYTTNTGTVTGVKVGSTSYNPSSGVVSLPAYPTSLPASDVYSWAKASSKPSYSASEVGAIATSAKGAASGVASLDSSGKVPSSQLPTASTSAAGIAQLYDGFDSESTTMGATAHAIRILKDTIYAGFHIKAHSATEGAGATISYRMSRNDFDPITGESSAGNRATGVYLLVCTNWATEPRVYIGLIAFSAADTGNAQVFPILAGYTPSISIASGVINVSSASKISLYSIY